LFGSVGFVWAGVLGFGVRYVAVSDAIGSVAAAVGVKRPWWPYAILAGALAAVVGAYLWLRPAPPSPLDNYTFHPFAFTRAQEHSGVWSPDGKSIAYIEQSAEGARLMVQNIDGTAPTELVEQISSQPGQIAWSPDSTRIYFLGLGRFNGVSAVSRAGGTPEHIIGDANFFHLSPDGKNLAIWRAKQNGEHTQQFSVWISSPPGTDPKPYTPAPFAVPTPFTPVTLRFSRDSKKIFLSMYTDEGAQTWLLPFPAGSGEPHRIFKDVRWSRPVMASWMPDNRHIVLSGNPAPLVNEQLYLADVEEETMTRIMALPQAGQVTPSVSPDGTQIAFSQIQRDRDILRFAVDGSAPTPIVATNLPEFGPSWSPTGDQLAFVTEQHGTDELWVRSPEGHWDRPIVTTKEFPTLQTIVSPIFSPDGTRIAYTALLVGGGRRRSLAISPVGGGDPTVISDGYGATWSPDGNTIAFLWLKSDGTLPVATLRVGSEQTPHPIFGTASKPEQRASGAPEWSPSGAWIAVPSFRGVEITSPDGSMQRLIPGISNATLAWSPDSKMLYALTFQSPHPNLSAIDIATDKIREIATYDVNFTPLLDNAYTGSLRMSMAPDGKSFAAATATAQADLWILDGFGR
jgi:Tol biopolymer transport system component